MVSESREPDGEQWSRAPRAWIAETIAVSSIWLSRPLVVQTFDSDASFRLK
jgi:hypothetical protein